MLHRWTEVLWDKGTGGGRWNYKIPMTELCLNGNFLNWFWRGARQNRHGETLKWGEREGFSFSFTLYLSGHVPALLTSVLICRFIPHLSFIRTHILLFQSLLLNHNFSRHSAHVSCSLHFLISIYAKMVDVQDSNPQGLYLDSGCKLN